MNTEMDQKSGPAAEDIVREGDRPSECILIFGRDRAPLDRRLRRNTPDPACGGLVLPDGERAEEDYPVGLRQPSPPRQNVKSPGERSVPGERDGAA
jgi:hypothetical protein